MTISASTSCLSCDGLTLNTSGRSFDAIAKFNLVSYSSLTQSVLTSILNFSLYRLIHTLLVISSPFGYLAEEYSDVTV
ncbi:hypothetical protein D3C74_422760 [compost metagenome]